MTNVNSAKRKIVPVFQGKHLTKECRHPAYYVFRDGSKSEGWCDLCREERVRRAVAASPYPDAFPEYSRTRDPAALPEVEAHREAEDFRFSEALLKADALRDAEIARRRPEHLRFDEYILCRRDPSTLPEEERRRFVLYLRAVKRIFNCDAEALAHEIARRREAAAKRRAELHRP